VRLAVEDNGVGFRVEEALARKDSFGLSGMRERVALLGGRFEIRSFPRNGPPSGTSIGPTIGTGIDAGTKAGLKTGIAKRSVDRKRTGRGTKILIRLPVAKQPPESSSIEPIAKPAGGRTARRMRALGA
jgi:glucose-6-phosphate-specific signal transduction histidine kinase